MADTKPRTAAQLAADEKRRQKAASAAEQKATDAVEAEAVAKAETVADSHGVGTKRVKALKNHHCKFIGTVYDLTKGENYTIPQDVYEAFTNPLLPGPIVQAL